MNIILRNIEIFIEGKDKIPNAQIDIITKLDYKFNKLIDTLAWWIPIIKWRDGFRDKFLK